MNHENSKDSIPAGRDRFQGIGVETLMSFDPEAHQAAEDRARREHAWSRSHGSWARDRRWSLLVLAGVTVALIISGLARAPSLIQSRYLMAVQQDLEGSPDAWTLRLAHKAASLDPDDLRSRFAVGLVLAGLDRKSEARRQIESCVVDGKVFLPAMRWLISDRLGKEAPGPQDLDEARNLLVRVSRAAPRSPQVRLSLAGVLLDQGRPDDALDHLAAAAGGMQGLHARVARLARERNRPDLAQKHALQAAGNLERLLEKAQTLDDPDRIRRTLLEMLMIAGEFDRAEMQVGHLKARHPEDESLGRIQSRIHLRRQERLENRARNNTPEVLKDRMTLLLEAARLPDADPEVLTRLTAMTLNAPQDRDTVRAILRDLLVRGRHPGLVHTLLGNLAWYDSDRRQAITHWGLALTKDPDEPMALNNWAWALLTGPRPDLEKALALVERSLKARPDWDAVHDTRGQILFALGRTQEATTSLETALEGMPKNRRLRQTLVKLYNRMGLPDIAAHHRSLL